MSTPTTTVTAFSDLNSDVIETHILSRLDAPTLASAATACHSLSSSSPLLWTAACHSAFPSLSSILPLFGPRMLLSLALPILLPAPTATSPAMPPPDRLVSGVDVFYKGVVIFSSALETETESKWFRCSPFRVDLIDPKDVVPTGERHPDSDMACDALSEQMSLSWVLVDMEGQRAANLSSHKPVSVQRHWLSGEVQVRFATILASGNRSSEFVQCAIVVTCGASERGEMQVREVSLQMEDMDGTHLVGKDSLVILHRALEGKRGNYKNREVEGRKRYNEYLTMKRERKEKKLRAEGTLDMLCVGFGATIFAAFSFWLVSLCSS